jgi:hypothetical protein
MSPEDDKVVNFLRQYRPHLPPLQTNREEQLMQIIAQEKQVTSSRLLPLLGIITGITALFMIMFSSYRQSNPSPGLTKISDEELEAFLVESWSNTIDGQSSSPTVDSSPWTSLSEPQLTYSTYNP